MKDLNYAFILPNGFKWVGVTLIATSVLLLVILKFVLGVHMSVAWIRLLISVVLIGLFIFVFTKEKIEDEMVARVRYISIMNSFWHSISIAIIVTPVLSFLKAPQWSAQELAIVMLVLYIAHFYRFILKAKHEKRD